MPLAVIIEDRSRGARSEVGVSRHGAIEAEQQVHRAHSVRLALVGFRDWERS